MRMQIGMVQYQMPEQKLDQQCTECGESIHDKHVRTAEELIADVKDHATGEGSIQDLQPRKINKCSKCGRVTRK